MGVLANRFILFSLVASRSLDVLAGLLNDNNPWTVKIAVQTYAGAYPLLFRSLCVSNFWCASASSALIFSASFAHRCANRNERPQWDTLSRAKSRIIELMWAPNTQAGVQFAAVKFLQKVILVQSRGIADPRVSCSFLVSRTPW